MEYVKFWIARDLWELSVVLTIFVVAVCIFSAMWVFDRIKAKIRKRSFKEKGE